MFPVTELYKQKINELDRTFDIEIKIYHSNGELTLNDEDLVSGSLVFDDGVQVGDNFTIGGTYASNIDFTIIKKPEYDSVNFIGARVDVFIKLKTQDGLDAHFMQPTQPSKFQEFDDKWEVVPLGKFNIDVADRSRVTIGIKAIDNMLYLDKPYTTELSYPVDLQMIYTDICTKCGVIPATINFPNKNYIVKEKPDGDVTYRNILSFLSELAGGFAKMNRYGQLEIRWYSEVDKLVDPNTRSNLKNSDDLVKITGVLYSTDDEYYIIGEDDYLIDISENPLISTGIESLLNVIYNNIKDVVFIPYTSEWQGDPAIEAGDIINQIDIDGNEYKSVVTHSKYKYRGKSIIYGKGQSYITRGFQNRTDDRIAKIVKKVNESVEDKFTDYESAMLNANELMANMLGSYMYKDEVGTIYMMDSPTLAGSTKIWKWGSTGFGYSDDGGEIWKSAITADGSIVANLVSAGIVTADMVKTGKLQSTNGKSWFDLDSGVLRIAHTGNQYSEMRGDGFVRKYEYGEGRYLTDIFTHYEYVFSTTTPINYSDRFTTIYLPQSFAYRNPSDIKVSASINNFLTQTWYWDDLQAYIYSNLQWQLVLNTPSPYIRMESYMEYRTYHQGGWNSDTYYKLGFSLVVVGN